MQVFQKTIDFSLATDFARVAEMYCMAMLIKIYGDLVMRIQEIKSEFPVNHVKGLQALVAFQNREAEKETMLKAKAS